MTTGALVDPFLGTPALPPAPRSIAYLRGPTQYGAAGYLVEAIAAAWRADGHEVVAIDMGPGLGRDLQRAFAARLDLVFAYNAVGASLAAGGRSLYDLAGARYVAWLVDHPCYHAERLDAAPASAAVLCVDPTHLGALAHIARAPARTGILVHPACPATTPPPPARDIDVLVPATLQPPASVRERWDALAPLVRDLCEGLAERMWLPSPPLLHEAWLDTLVARALEPRDLGTAGAALVLREVDTWLRAMRRERLLAALAEAGLTALVCGHAATGAVGLYNHQWIGPVPFAELLRLMQRSRAVVDAGAAFPAGSHERGLAALANGALAVVEDNAFWRAAPGPASAIRFRWDALDELGADLRWWLDDERNRAARADAGRHLAGLHSPVVRARELVARAPLAA